MDVGKVLVLVPHHQMHQVKRALGEGVEVAFATGRQGPSQIALAASRARVIVTDPGNAAQQGTDAVRIGARLGVPSILYIDMGDASMSAVLPALELGLTDVLISPLDSDQRFSAAMSFCDKRRWPLFLARQLAPELSALPNGLGLHTFAMLCGASLPPSVEDFCLSGGVSVSTATRKFIAAGIPSMRRLIVGSRLVQVFEALRESGGSQHVPRKFFGGNPAAVRRALREFAGASLAELRYGLMGEELVQRVARVIRRNPPKAQALLVECCRELGPFDEKPPEMTNSDRL